MPWIKHATKFVIGTSSGAAGLAQVYTAWQTWELDPDVHWQIASYDSNTPAYLVLKKKDGSAGRIMFTGGSTIHTSFAGYSETTNVNSVYMIYDFTATSDVPNANYNTGVGGALFSPTSETRGRFRAVPVGSGSYNFTLYCNADADIVWMWAGNGGTQAIAFTWGKLFRADNGTTPLCYSTPGWISIAAGSGNRLGAQSPANSYSNNVAGSVSLWVYDNAANEGVTTAVHYVLEGMNYSGSALPWGGQGSYNSANQQFTLPNGVRRFLPSICYVQANNAMARPSFIGLTSRYWGHSAPLVLDAVWTDNSATTQGYYLGSNTTAINEGCMLSVINSTF